MGCAKISIMRGTVGRICALGFSTGPGGWVISTHKRKSSWERGERTSLLPGTETSAKLSIPFYVTTLPYYPPPTFLPSGCGSYCILRKSLQKKHLLITTPHQTGNIHTYGCMYPYFRAKAGWMKIGLQTFGHVQSCGASAYFQLELERRGGGKTCLFVDVHEYDV